MGFKREIMPAFFKAWEETWRKWIEPVPFLNYPNPVPSFAGSAFCTEQYALGMILESDVVTRADVYELRRITFPLRGITTPNGNGTATNNNNNTSANLDLNWTSFSYSERSISENELALLEEKFKRSLSFSSWGGSFSQTSWGETSWGSSGSEYSFSFSSWANIYPEFSFSYSSWETTSFGGSFTSSGLSFENFSFGSSGSSARGIWAPVDNIEGKIVHFYSTFYDQSQSWWQGNSADVIPQINQYWDNRNQRPAYVVVPPATTTQQRTTTPNYYSQQQQQQRVSPPQQLRRDDLPGL